MKTNNNPFLVGLVLLLCVVAFLFPKTNKHNQGKSSTQKTGVQSAPTTPVYAKPNVSGNSQTASTDKNASQPKTDRQPAPNYSGNTTIAKSTQNEPNSKHFAPNKTENPTISAPKTKGKRGRIGAICRDGSTSHATGSGACSHHGGVARWVYGDEAVSAGQANPVYTQTVKKSPKKHNSTDCVRVGAICNDGSRSSATGRGACSHHGGVSQWICQ